MKRIIVGLTLVLLTCFTLRADEPMSGELFQIRNVEFGNMLRPLNARTDDGAPIVLYPAAPWKCMTWKCVADSDGFALQNQFSSKTLSGSEPAQGQPQYVTQVPWSDRAAERPVWKFTKLDDGTYTVADSKTGRMLTAVKDAQYGVRITLEPAGNKASQRWEVLKAPEHLTM